MDRYVTPHNLNLLNIKAIFTLKHFVEEKGRIYEGLVHEFDISQGNIYLPVQRHTNTVHVVEDEEETVVADAVITSKKNLLIGVLVADCVPILLCDSKKEVVGAVHAGWRGTSKEILKNSLGIMKERFNCKIDDVAVAIGPSIRQCSYEVDEVVKNEVEKATGKGDYFIEKGGKYFIDLSTANKIQAIGMGVREENIWQSEECTYCNPDRFYSYRYSQGAVTGRQGGFIGMW